jgi:hypothetical protein
MHLIQVDSMRWFEFEAFLGQKLKHAVFTRHGGISPEPWAELNLGSSVGDDLRNVMENRERAFRVFGRPVQSLFDVWQVHSADVVRADAPRAPHVPHQRADAIVTNCPDITLIMRFADCVPILIYDPVHKALGLAHAGWQGTVKKITAKTIQVMHQEFGSIPKDLIAGIGPSICSEHYQVGPDVVSRVCNAFGDNAKRFLHGNGEKRCLDLWQANRFILEQAGVYQIEVGGICTACHNEDWFSHRAEHGKTGRFGVMAAIEA